MACHLDSLVRPDSLAGVGINTDLESRQIGLPFFPCFLQIGKTRRLGDEANRPGNGLAIGYGDTGQGLAFVEMDGLLFTDIDIVILALTFQEDDRRVGLDDFPLFGQELEDFPVFRRPQGPAVFLDFQLLELDLELIALLDQRFPVVTLIGNGLPLFFNLRQLEGITVPRIDGTAQ